MVDDPGSYPSFDQRVRDITRRILKHWLVYNFVGRPIVVFFVIGIYLLIVVYRQNVSTDYTQFAPLGPLTRLQTRMTGSMHESWENNPAYIAAGRPTEPLEYLPFTNYGESLRVDLWLTDVGFQSLRGKIRFYRSRSDRPGPARGEALWQAFEGTRIGGQFQIRAAVPPPLGGDEPLLFRGSVYQPDKGFELSGRLAGEWYRDDRPMGYFSIEPLLRPDPESPHAALRNRVPPNTPFDGLVAGEDY